MSTSGKDKDYIDLLVEVTKIAASIEYLRINAAERNGKEDERSSVMKQGLLDIKTEFRKEFQSMNCRVEKLETTRTKILGAWGLLAIFGAVIPTGIAFWKWMTT